MRRKPSPRREETRLAIRRRTSASRPRPPRAIQVPLAILLMRPILCIRGASAAGAVARPSLPSVQKGTDHENDLALSLVAAALIAGRPASAASRPSRGPGPETAWRPPRRRSDDRPGGGPDARGGPLRSRPPDYPGATRTKLEKEAKTATPVTEAKFVTNDAFDAVKKFYADAISATAGR